MSATNRGGHHPLRRKVVSKLSLKKKKLNPLKRLKNKRGKHKDNYILYFQLYVPWIPLSKSRLSTIRIPNLYQEAATFTSKRDIWARFFLIQTQ